MLETECMMGLLQQEASKLGIILSDIAHSDTVEYKNLHLDEHDSHYY
jgi:hypothetical protein